MIDLVSQCKILVWVILISGELELDVSSIKLTPRRKNMLVKVQERETCFGRNKGAENEDRQ